MENKDTQLGPLTQHQWDELRVLGPQTTYNYVHTATPGGSVGSIRSIKNEKDFFVINRENTLYAKIEISDYHVEDTTRWSPSLFFIWHKDGWHEEKSLLKKLEMDKWEMTKINFTPPPAF
jgi:hypothetical protein